MFLNCGPFQMNSLYGSFEASMFPKSEAGSFRLAGLGVGCSIGVDKLVTEPAFSAVLQCRSGCGGCRPGRPLRQRPCGA